MTQSLAELLTALKGKPHITAEDALAVRQRLYGDDAISRDEAQAIADIDASAASTAPEWKALYLEALSDFVVFQQTPRGYVDDATAGWLTALVLRDGRIRTDTELEIIIEVLEKADSAPDTLSRFALGALKASILRPRPKGEAPSISRQDVERLRRVIFAFAAEGNVTVTRPEAETLLDLNDAVRGAANDPSWTDFFAKAVGSSVLTVSTYRAPSRQDALKADAWLHAPTPGVFGMLGQMARGLPHALDRTPDAEQLWGDREAVQDAADKAAAPVDEDEGRWLVARIGRDGGFDENEKALIEFIRSCSPDISPALKPLLDQAA